MPILQRLDGPPCWRCGAPQPPPPRPARRPPCQRCGGPTLAEPDLDGPGRCLLCLWCGHRARVSPVDMRARAR